MRSASEGFPASARITVSSMCAARSAASVREISALCLRSRTRPHRRCGTMPPARVDADLWKCERLGHARARRHINGPNVDDGSGIEVFDELRVSDLACAYTDGQRPEHDARRPASHLIAFPSVMWRLANVSGALPVSTHLTHVHYPRRHEGHEAKYWFPSCPSSRRRS